MSDVTPTAGQDDLAAGAEDALEDGAATPAGDRSRDVLEYLARSLTDEPDAVRIEESPTRNGTRLSLQVAPDDMGRVIGRRGRVAQAIRTVVRAAAAAEGRDVSVDIVD
ncbi:MAG TPA: KH domain-containing protein [Acidimicrobiales bacterium]|nr:KH domain-containing protein [Acidimicrobiales bacterium]